MTARFHPDPLVREWRYLRHHPALMRLYLQCCHGMISVRQLREELERQLEIAQRRRWTLRVEVLESVSATFPSAATKSRRMFRRRARRPLGALA